MSITLESELLGMQKISEAVALTLKEMRNYAQPGISTKQLDDYGGQILQDFGAKSAPRLTYGFPGWTCISLNNEIAHGIPGDKKIIQEGDLLNIDVSAELDGFWADNGGSFVVGTDHHAHQKLVDISKHILKKAIDHIRGGVRISEIGHLIETEAKKAGYKVIKNLTGHGVGRSLHEEPHEIANYRDPYNHRRFKKMNRMKNKHILNYTGLIATLLFTACSVPYLGRKTENRTVPAFYNNSGDTVNIAKVNWKNYFKDPYLQSLIDSALLKNQELNILLQEINMSSNEIRARKGAYLPMVGVGAAAGVEKVGRYTSQGANDANTEITPGKKVPEVLPNYFVGLTASWEVDIWKKLRNAKKSAVYRYLSSIEGKNFMVTNLIAEISNAYYELMALDNQLDILKENISIQQNALEIVKLEKISAKVTELAVRRFEAEVLKNQSNQYYIMQQITETENRINFLLGRFPQPIQRNSRVFADIVPDSIHAGIPSNLLQNRPDIRQAEQELQAAKIDVKVAKANFYPSFISHAPNIISTFTFRPVT
jgi:methionine aminopeptidase type I